MINLYFTLKLLIPVVIILAVILAIVILAIKRKLDSRFKQNCYECKHYRLFDVASCGGRCRYKCSLKNRIDYNNINDDEKFIKCEDFEQKEREERLGK